MSVCSLTIMRNRQNGSKWPKNIVVAYRSTTDAYICLPGLVQWYLTCYILYIIHACNNAYTITLYHHEKNKEQIRNISGWKWLKLKNNPGSPKNLVCYKKNMYCRCCKKVATVLMKKLSPQNLGASDADCSRCTPSPCTKEKKSSTDDWSPWNRIPRTPSFVIPSFPESLVRFINSYCWSFA